MASIRVNALEMEWTDEGCVAKATGFSGVLLTCPRCQELLPRDTEHRCGNKATAPLKKRKQVRKEASDEDNA